MTTTNVNKETVEMNNTEEKAMENQTTEAMLEQVTETVSEQTTETVPEQLSKRKMENENTTLSTEQETKALSVEQTNTDIIVEPPKATIAITPRLEDMIEKSVRAQNAEEKSTAIRSLENAGLLSPASHLYQIVNRCNNCIFAGVYVDDEGNRYIHFRQQYKNGKYSPEFSISQDDLLNVYAGGENATDDEKREAKASLKRIKREYFRKIDSNEIISVGKLVAAIAEVLPMLPEENQTYELSQYELYTEVIEIMGRMGHGKSTLDLLRDEKRGYFVLDDIILETLSQELGFSRKELLIQLKKKNLLYLTGSCKGYQCKIPYSKSADGRIRYEWAYCIYDLEFLGKYKDGDKPEPDIIEPVI